MAICWIRKTVFYYFHYTIDLKLCYSCVCGIDIDIKFVVVTSILILKNLNFPFFIIKQFEFVTEYRRNSLRNLVSSK